METKKITIDGVDFSTLSYYELEGKFLVYSQAYRVNVVCLASRKLNSPPTTRDEIADRERDNQVFSAQMAENFDIARAALHLLQQKHSSKLCGDDHLMEQVNKFLKASMEKTGS